MGTLAVRHGVAFGPEYASVLGKMVRGHHGSELVTLTDQEDTPGRKAKLKAGLWGWWAKFELFAPWNRHLRPCLYFDLDTFIVGDIRDIQPDGGFWMLSDFNNEKGQSGMMILPEDTDEIWEFVKDAPLKGGDADYLRKFPHRKLQDEYEGIVSYKQDVLYGRTGRIVCFHGRPRPHEAKDWPRGDGSWAGRIWAQYGGT